MYDAVDIRQTDKSDNAPIWGQSGHYAEVIHRLSTALCGPVTRSL
jgi:hypothetical protein